MKRVLTALALFVATPLVAGDAIVPSDKQLGNMIYENVEAASFQLKQGRYVGEPYKEDAPDRLEVTLLEELTMRGDLNEDGVDDAAVILETTTGSDRRKYWLSAATGRYGRPASFGSLLLGDRLELLESGIEDGNIELRTAEYAKTDRECPTQLWIKRWAVVDGELKPTAAYVVGQRECSATE
jgi:hypothetical protein